MFWKYGEKQPDLSEHQTNCMPSFCYILKQPNDDTKKTKIHHNWAYH